MYNINRLGRPENDICCGAVPKLNVAHRMNLQNITTFRLINNNKNFFRLSLYFSIF